MSRVSQANQHSGDEREQKCWDLYIKNIASGSQNAYKAAIDAGYSEDHARNITMQGWFKERLSKLRRTEMLSKAEKVLEETLDLDPKTYKTVGEEEVAITDPQLLKIKQDTAKFVAERVGKEHYSQRSEMTGKDGESLQVNVVSYANNNPAPVQS